MNREEQKSTALSTKVRRVREKNPLVEALDAALRRRRENNAELLLDLAVGLTAALFAMTHAAFGVYPFSLALLLATTGRTLTVFLGGAVGCAFLGEAGALYLALHIFALLYRIVASYPRVRRRLPESRGIFDEEPVLRVLGATLLGFGMALYELILFGAQAYTLLFAAGATLFLPLCTLVFAFFAAQRLPLREIFGRVPMSPLVYFGRHATFLLSLGGVFLLYVCARALLPYTLFGVSLSGCATTAFTLFISRRYGAARGCAAGLLVGLAGEAVYLPVYGLLGLLSGLYGGIGMPLSLAAAVLAGGGYAAYVGGLSGFLSVMPEMTVTSLLLSVPLRSVTAEAADGEAVPHTVPDPKTPTEKEGLDTLAAALFEVSQQLAAAADRNRTPAPEEFESLCQSVRERICRRCPAEGSCLENEAVSESLRATVIRLSIGEGTSESGASPCEGYGKMLEEIREGAAALAQKKRQGGRRGALSADYALFSELLKERSAAHAAEEGRDGALEEALKGALSAHGMSAEEICIEGGRKKRLLLRAVRAEGDQRVEGEWVEDACARVCGRGILPLRFSQKQGVLSFTAESRLAFSVEGGCYTAAGSAGECAADCATTLLSEQGFAYAILCDGMGSGRGAAEMASLGVSVLKTLLGADVSRRVALALLNNAICSSESECSVALDLLSFDLYEGRASFLKSGAAASFVFRDGALFRIRSRTIPLGLLRIVDSEEACFEVRDGDMIVLLSDGVLGESEESGWLKEILSSGGKSEELARRIVQSAERRRTSDDDKTAVVLSIRAAEGGRAQKNRANSGKTS